MEEIVNGIETFREAFTPFADSFIVIGGSACRAVIPDGDIRPRKTTDIDMVLVPQELSAGFIGTFWKFIKEGGYKFASRKNKDGDNNTACLFLAEDLDNLYRAGLLEGLAFFTG